MSVVTAITKENLICCSYIMFFIYHWQMWCFHFLHPLPQFLCFLLVSSSWQFFSRLALMVVPVSSHRYLHAELLTSCMQKHNAVIHEACNEHYTFVHYNIQGSSQARPPSTAAGGRALANYKTPEWLNAILDYMKKVKLGISMVSRPTLTLTAGLSIEVSMHDAHYQFHATFYSFLVCEAFKIMFGGKLKMQKVGDMY